MQPPQPPWASAAELPPEAHVTIHHRLRTDSIRFSLIIPTFQEQSVLATTLESFSEALRNRYGVELIISDGGSTDATLEIAHLHADIVVAHTGPYRQSIAQGRNWGARVASGSILLFLNADSVPANPERFFWHIHRWAEEAPDEVALACPVYVHPAVAVWKDRAFHSFYNRYFALLNACGLGIGRGECHIVRRWAFERVGGYNEQLYAGEDFDLYRRLRRLGRIRMAWELPIYESPRRYRRYGYARTLWLWTINAFAVLFLHRSIARSWEPIREPSDKVPQMSC